MKRTLGTFAIMAALAASAVGFAATGSTATASLPASNLTLTHEDSSNVALAGGGEAECEKRTIRWEAIYSTTSN